MAKRKHALFEVIVNAKGLPQGSRAGTVSVMVPAMKPVVAQVPTPRLWISKLTTTPVRPRIDDVTVVYGPKTAEVVVPPATIKPNRVIAGHSAAPSIPFARQSLPKPPVDLRIPKCKTDRPLRESFGFPAASSARATSMAGSSLLGGHRRIRLPLDRQSLVLAGIGLTLLVSVTLLVAKLINRHNGGTTTAMGSNSTNTIKRGPVQPGVLEVQRHTFNPVAQQARSTQLSVPSDATSNEPRPPVGSVTRNAKRIANLNYLVLQSYDRIEEKQARAACEFLNNHGIPCTVETNVKGHGNRVSIVGIDGFAQRYLSNPQYVPYVEKITKVTKDYQPKSSHGFSTTDFVQWQ